MAGRNAPPDDYNMEYKQGFIPPPIRYEPNEGRPFHEDDDKPNTFMDYLKYFLFLFCMIIFLAGLALLGVGIWLAIDRAFMTYIIGNYIYIVAIYFILIGGGILFIVSILGCCATSSENRCMTWTFFVFLVVLFLIIFVGGILAIVLRIQLGDSIKRSMEDTLKNYYGVNFQHDFNRFVTDAWDKTQERLYCCGVVNEGWNVYRSSQWFSSYGPFEELGGVMRSDVMQKPFVPQSCCVKDRYWRYIDLEVCQKWRFGPPGSPIDGAINRALYYHGCYDAAVEYLTENSSILIGLGIGIGLLLVVGIVLTFFMLRQQKKEQG